MTYLDWLVLEVPHEDAVIILLHYPEELTQVEDAFLLCLCLPSGACVFWLHIKFKISLL